jgi:hypothetical protein
MPKAPAEHGAFPDPSVFILAVISASLAQIFCGVASQNFFKQFGFGRRALVEVTTNKVFRKLSSPGAAYVSGGAPFVHSLLFCVAYWILDCKPPVRPILLAIVLWVCGAFHSILIEFCSIRYSFDVAAYYMVTSLINALVMAATVEWIYEKHHWE